MPFNVEEFKSNGLRLGGARPSLFEIEINDWPGSELVRESPRRLSFFAKASSLPPSIVESIDIPYFGRKIKMVGDRVFPNWSITVMNEEDFQVRKSLLNWHEALNAKVPNVLGLVGNTSTDISTYKKDIKIRHYTKTGKINFTCTLVGAFPVTIDAIQLDWDAINQIEQFDVEFAYDYWIGKEIGEGGVFDGADSFTGNEEAGALLE